jgi:hypothetical protein
MTPAILAIWYTSIGLRVLLMAALVRRRLALRYPGLSVFLLVSLACSGYLVAVWVSGHSQRAYCFAWTSVQTFEAASNAIVSLEAFRAMTKFRNTGSFGVALMTVFGGLSALAVWSTTRVILPGFNPAMLADRYYTAICLGFLLLSFLFWRSSPMRANARWYVRILIVYFAGDVLGFNLLLVANTPAARAANMLLSMVCYALWAIKMVPAGEAFTPLMNAEERERLFIEAEEMAGMLGGLRKHARKGQPPSALDG